MYIDITEDDFVKFRADGCPICRTVNIDNNETLQNSRTVIKADIIKTECSHLYHLECMIVQANINPDDTKCPLCRRKIYKTINNLKSIRANRLLKEAVESNHPYRARDIIEQNPHMHIDIQILNLGLTMALEEENIKKITLWLQLGANNSIIIDKKLKECLENNEEEKALYLINLGIKPNDPTINNSILHFLAERNKPSLFKRYAETIVQGMYQNILKKGINEAASQNSINDTEEWIDCGAVLTAETITEGLKQAVEIEDAAGASQWLWLAKRYNINELNTCEILGVGLQKAANNNKPYLGKKWIVLGANSDINILNKGLKTASQRGDHQSAKTWLNLGAERNIMVLNQAYINDDSDNKSMWLILGAQPAVNELNLELEVALASNNFTKVMLLLKQGALASIDDMNAAKERMQNNPSWQKLINKYTKNMQ